jgi:hypothetical protein
MNTSKSYTGDSLGLGNILSRSLSKLSALTTDHDRSPVVQRQNPGHEQSASHSSSGRAIVQRSQSDEFEMEP